ncbi:Hypothetical predicted protein [Lecanosticta acicola]|uniref:Uncharacterized protein n=1 Tax=Lecanosticta acicola TaxID=111012 RepID=A0AAI8Z8C0_9PEZI|nr:Hypothetical predicted protein [Lecanosticta acicola]
MDHPSMAEVRAVVDLLVQEVTAENLAGILSDDESALLAQWMNVHERVCRAGYGAAILAASSFCVFEVTLKPSEKLHHLYRTMIAVAEGLERDAGKLIPHGGTTDSRYNLLYGLYAICIATNQVPTLEEIGHIHGRCLPLGPPLLRAYRDWCDSSVLLQRHRDDKAYAPALLRVLRGALVGWGQNAIPLLVQVMVGLERWGADVAVAEFLRGYGVAGGGGQVSRTQAPAPAPVPTPAPMQDQSQSPQHIRPAQTIEDPFTGQAAPLALPRRTRNAAAATTAPKNLPSVDDEDDEDEDVKYEEIDDPKDEDYKE